VEKIVCSKIDRRKKAGRLKKRSVTENRSPKIALGKNHSHAKNRSRRKSSAQKNRPLGKSVRGRKIARVEIRQVIRKKSSTERVAAVKSGPREIFDGTKITVLEKIARR